MKAEHLLVYPNPASSGITVMLDEFAENEAVTMTIQNNLGQQVLLRDFGPVPFVNERVDISGLGNGIYFVSLKVGQQRFEQKLVVSKD